MRRIDASVITLSISQLVEQADMKRLFFLLGSLTGGLAVAAGAFGAHGLTKVLLAEQLEIYEKADWLLQLDDYTSL